ncbi:Malate:quinone-oxidoreductase [Rhodopirellula maiorica SM1]|uniref:Probable malate:quinone oxidoreductase n=2 Tax=Novipirellula TaxID=2795426 RepID=M5RU41_9BACT|nr:Malate:quinone-oxidoreductase [Rhodopirellula maiorica SM1]
MYIDDPDVILIGSGVMSANLGAMLKRLRPELKIQLFEVSEDLAQESSNAWNNAGTGHAGICELSYTPNRNPDGSVDVSNAISIFEQFEQSRQFWGYAVAEGMIDSPHEFINPVPHISFVHGQAQVDFLKARYDAMSSHHFFSEMEFSTDRDTIRQWAPLLVNGRDSTPIAATRMLSGTDVNFGSLSRKLIQWMQTQPGCGVATHHRVNGLRRTSSGWDVSVRDLSSGKPVKTSAKFVFIGAGGGSLSLLQKSGIPESKGFGGFPIGGQWLVCDDPAIVAQHQAKVYGQAQDEAPTMAVPHLDTRVIDGKKAILFGPFAAWTTRFLKDQGHITDLPFSIRPDNIASLLKVGAYNLPLVKYLVQQGLQSMGSRMKLLRTFYPEAKTNDWRLMDAGIRVQAIKREDGEAGIVHYGTEIVTDKDNTIAALLGASPGASVSVSLMLQVIQNCLPHLLETPQAASTMKQLIPSYDESLQSPSAAERFEHIHAISDHQLQLQTD